MSFSQRNSLTQFCSNNIFKRFNVAYLSPRFMNFLIILKIITITITIIINPIQNKIKNKI